MDRENLIERINQVLHEGFEIPKARLTPDAHLFEDLELDSLDAVDMLVHIEETLKVKVDTERFKNVRKLEDVYNLLFEIAPSGNA